MALCATTTPFVDLTVNEALACLFQASQRITASEAMGLNHASTYDRSIFTRISEEHVGAMGERALAKWLLAYYGDGINTFHGPDCLSYQVRATRRHDGHLIVRPRHGSVTADDPRSVYVLAIVDDALRVVFPGWLFGYKASRNDWFRSGPGRPAWWVPQSALNNMNCLPGVRHE